MLVGVLSRKELLLNVLKSKWTNRVIKEFNLLGNNEFVISKFADLSAQKEGFFDKKAIGFSVKKIIGEQSAETIQTILDVFEAEKIIDKENRKKAIILTQAFMSRNNISAGEQKLIYALLIDYFCENMDIYIKPHPIDLFSTYNEWFPEAKIINERIPSEIIGGCISKNFDLGISVSSTAIYSIDNNVNKIICFDSDMEDKIKDIHKYYVLAKILEKIKTKKYDIICAEGINLKVLNEMVLMRTSICKNSILINSLNKNIRNGQKIYIVNNKKDIQNVEISEEDIIIIINIESEELSYILDQNKIFVKYKIVDSKKLVNKEEERGLLVEAKNKGKIEEVSTIDIQNELIHSQLEIRIKGYSYLPEAEKDIIIKVLKNKYRNKEEF